MARRFKPVLAVLLIFYLVVHLFSLNLQQKPHVREYEKWIVWATTPVEYIVGGAARNVASVWNHYIYLIGAAKENDQLRVERDHLHTKLRSQHESAEENKRLRRLLGLQEATNLRVLVAERIAGGMSPYERTIRINRGEANNLQSGMAVIHPQGIIGQILQTYPSTADILLLVDKASAIDVVVQRSRVRGILRGYRLRELRFEYLPKKEDVDVGDEIVASGLDGVYPAGFPIGVVERVNRELRGMFLEAAVRPHVNFGRLEEVSVVLGAAK